jgi:hypothetical protein
MDLRPPAGLQVGVQENFVVHRADPFHSDGDYDGYVDDKGNVNADNTYKQ